MTDDQHNIQTLIEENLKLSREIHRSVERTRRYILWGKALETLKFLFVIGALAGAYFLIEPYIREFYGLYQQFFTSVPPEQSSAPLFDQFRKILEPYSAPR